MDVISIHNAFLIGNRQTKKRKGKHEAKQYFRISTHDNGQECGNMKCSDEF
jgi:hypothetical protein